MILLLSGEGATDFGGCISSEFLCSGENYKYGVMTVILDKLIEAKLQYSSLSCSLVYFCSKERLGEIAKKLPLPATFPGNKTKKETAFFIKNAQALAYQAKILSAENSNDIVVSILFRDSDGTNTSNSDEWDDKWNSIIAGFERANYDYGVPMLPKPKSEAWLLCALKEEPYESCDKLEHESGNDASPKSLKKQLKERLNQYTSQDLVNLLEENQIDIFRINMNSFNCFKKRLDEVLQKVISEH